MEYNGKELIEMSPEKWDGKLRTMLVWNCVNDTPIKARIVEWYKNEHGHIIWRDVSCKFWNYCAEISEGEPRLEIYPRWDFVEIIMKTIQERNGSFTIPKRAVEQMREIEKACGIVYEKNKKLKEENEKLKNEVNELKNSSSYLVYGEMCNEQNKLKEKIKSLRTERVKMADEVSSAVWKELMDRAENIDGPVNTRMAGFGFNDISDIVLNKILDYPYENKQPKEEKPNCEVGECLGNSCLGEDACNEPMIKE